MQNEHSYHNNAFITKSFRYFQKLKYIYTQISFEFKLNACKGNYSGGNNNGINYYHYYYYYGSCCKRVNRKVQGMPQSQTAANPRHQEEEKNDKN